MPIEDGYYVKLGATFDATGIQQAQDAVGKLAGDLSGSMANLSTAMDAAAAGVGKVSQAIGAVGSGAGGGLSQFEQELAKCGQDIADLQAKAEAAKGPLERMAEAARAGWDEAAAKMQDFAKRADEMSGSFLRIGAGLSAALTAPIVGFAMEAYKAFDAMDYGLDKIRASVTATGPALDALGESFRNVVRQVPDDIRKVGDAFAYLAANFQITGKPLEDLTVQIVNLAHITGESLQGLATQIPKAFKDASVPVEQYGAAMDKLYRVHQLTGQSVTDLTQKMAQYGTPLRQLGIDFDTAALMIGKFQQEGVRVELVLAAMKKSLADSSKNAKEPVAAFQELIEKIKNTDVATGNLIAQQITGVRTMADFAGAVREGRLDLAALLELLNKGGEGINEAALRTRDLSEAWGLFSHSMVLALEPLGNALQKLVVDAMPALDVLAGVVASLAKWFSELSEPAQYFTVALLGILAAIGPVTIAVAGFAAVIGVLSSAAGIAAVVIMAKALAIAIGAVALAFGAWKLSEWLYSLEPVRNAIDTLVKGFQQLWTWMQMLPGMSLIVRGAGQVWDGIKKAVADFSDEVKKGVKNLGDMGHAAIDTAAKHQDLITKVQALEAILKDHNKAYQQLSGETLPQYYARLQQAVAALGAHGKAHDEAAAAAKRLQQQLQATSESLDRMIASWGKGTLWNVQGFVDSGVKVQTVFKQIDAESVKLQQQLAKTFDETAQAKIKGWLVDLDVFRQTLTDTAKAAAQIALDKSFKAMEEAIKAAQVPAEKLAQTLLTMSGYQTIVAANMKGATDAVKTMDDAVKAFGVTLEVDATAKFEKLNTQFDQMVKLYQEGKLSAEEFAKAQLKLAEASLAYAIEQGKTNEEIANIKGAVDRAKSSLDDFGPHVTQTSKLFDQLEQDTKRLWHSFQNDVADALIHFQGFGAAAEKIAIGIKDALIHFIVNQAMDAIAKSLLNGTDLFKQFASAVSGIIGGLVKGISSAFSSLFGGALGGAAGGAGGGGGGGAAGGLGGILSGGVTGIVGAVASIGSLITSIISAFSQARMEQDIGRIEVTSREIKAELMNFRKDAWDRETHWYARTSDILDAINRIADAGMNMSAGGIMADILGAINRFGDQGMKYLSEILGNMEHLVAGGGGGQTNQLLEGIQDALRTGVQQIVTWLQQSNKILVEIDNAVQFTAQKLGKPEWQVQVANFPASQLAPVGPSNQVTINNPTFSSFTPQQLATQVMQTISNALGKR